MAIKCYNLPNRYYSFKIEKKALNRLSESLYIEMLPTAQKMVIHHDRLKSGSPNHRWVGIPKMTHEEKLAKTRKRKRENRLKKGLTVRRHTWKK